MHEEALPKIKILSHQIERSSTRPRMRRCYMRAQLFATIAFLLTFFVSAVAEGPAAGAGDNTPSEHAKAQIGRLHEIKILFDAGRINDAQKRIVEARVRSTEVGDKDPQGIDGDEMEVALLALQQRFADARSASNNVISRRRAGPASEQLLLCWALLQHAIILDGTGDTAGADKVLLESIGAGRNAFAAGDHRRAQMLEAFADLMARGYNRPLAGISLYQAAIEAREALTDGSRADLAETLRKLALFEPPQGLDLTADRHLERAVSLLQAEADSASNETARQETNGEIATLLGMRVGLAGRAQRFEEARNRLREARARAIGTASAPFMDLYAADVDRREGEAKGDFSSALTAVQRGISAANALNDGNSAGLVASLELVQGRLQVEQGHFEGAEFTVKHALDAFSRSPTPEGAHIAEGWLLLARIESARGQEARAKRWVTGALAMLKTRRSEVLVTFATNRAARENEPQMYGAKTSTEVSSGEALVLVPGAPPMPGAGLSTLGGATELEKLLVTNVRRLDPEALAASAKARATASKIYPKSALLFVHGFSTSFECAVARAAQISRDVAYDGPTFLFSWPSQGKSDPLSYSADEKAANASVDALVDFMRTIQEITGAEKTHIVAHSMGNQLLLKALGKLRETYPESAAHIGEVVFASPDVDQTDFKEGVGKLKGLAMTLYASAYDKALWLSSWRNWATRAGSVSSGLLSSGLPMLVSGVDSIDVSEAGRDYFSFNHDTYVSSPHVANDLRRLLQVGERPPARRSSEVMIERGSPPDRYWVYQTNAAR